MESYYSVEDIYQCIWGTLSSKSPQGEIHRLRQAPLKLSYSTLAGPRDSPTPPPLLLVIVTTTPSYQVSHPFLRGSGNWSLYAHLLDCTSQAYKAYIKVFNRGFKIEREILLDGASRPSIVPSQCLKRWIQQLWSPANFLGFHWKDMVSSGGLSFKSITWTGTTQLPERPPPSVAWIFKVEVWID